jgi:hypothetical protein
MNFPRETIALALYSHLSSLTSSFTTITRYNQVWSSVEPANQPFLGVEEVSNKSVRGVDGMITWYFGFRLWIYCQHQIQSDIVPSTKINTLLDVIENSLQPPSGEKQTLGGIVVDAWIDGTIIIAEGTLPSDVQSIVMIPVTVLTGI